MKNITGVFENGEDGLICRRPSDRGAWIAPDRATTPRRGVKYVLKITGTSVSGKLRYASIVETVEEKNSRERVQLSKALENGDCEVEAPYGHSSCFVSFQGQKYFLSLVQGKLQSSELRCSFPMTAVVEKVLEPLRIAWEQRQAAEAAAKEALEAAAQELYQAEEAAIQAEEIKRQIEQAKEDSPKVMNFFAHFPEARQWFVSDPTWVQVEDEAVKRQIAVFVGLQKVDHYATSYKELDVYKQNWELRVGLETYVFTRLWSGEIYGDD